ncbi:isoleucyl-tRNA synthetase [Methanococcus maripaludis]|uniref:Isoleucine--tRNA ligase n=1 Tax=Methanococcus maripaludis TaxID=39152 RepID=A0A7J9S4V3_METMI|nr:isoleucine--tRNA ligase [Methanococcus maripaludis]MBB6401330.1 isoleucyl-tRNA synthetase [Methanococcus maripaludis]
MKQVKSVNFRELDKKVKEYWKKENTYKKVKALNEHGPEYYFVDGPPYCSGAIHLGTAWNKIIKDTVLRFKRIQGYNVLDKAGWDMHGLPIEVKVENEFNIGSKKDIETKIGTQEFINKCKEFALNHLGHMQGQFENLGVWLDFENAYMPIKRDYMEMGWWTLKKAHEKELLTKDLRSGYWCPRCETSLAEHEVRGEYKEVLDPSVYVKFKLENSDEYITIWTTTPWTLPSNMLVCVNPEFDYAYVDVEFENGTVETWVIAEKLVNDVMKKAEKNNEISKFSISKVVKGDSLIGLKYIHPLLEENEKQQEFAKIENVHTIVAGDHVTLEGGTGLVHTAPGFGEDDFNIGKEHNIPVYAPIDDNGKYTDSIWKGTFVKDMDESVIETLISKNLLVNSGKVKHTYPHCWRCKTPLLFRATEQWFLSISKIKESIIEQGKTVDWVPDWVKTRYVNGVSFVGDWNISRQRYWGIPLPIWICEECGNYEVIGSVDELTERANEKDVDLSDIHKPAVDKITLTCSCGGKMKRTPDVLDVWYDSGLAPYASIGSKKLKKAQFITEGNDQVTKWFYSQHALSAVVFDDTSYEKCMMHGFTLDETGEKMSKSLGNIVSPDDVTEQYGADVLRFYLLSANKAWEDLRFSYSEMDETRSMLNTLWNSYAFSANYMVLDDFVPNDEYFKHVKDEDAWILSRINTVAKEAVEALEKPHLHVYTWALRDFILNDFSRWYIKLIRDRTWMEKNDVQKLSAYQTLYYVIMKLISIMAPVTPHLSEEIYQNLKTEDMPESIFMNKLTIESEFINKTLEKDTEIIREIVDSILKGRDKAKYTLRYPITKITLPENIAETVEKYGYIIKEQGNVKEIELKEFEGNITVKPNFKELGKIFRSDVPKVVAAINSVAPSELKEKLKSGEFEVSEYTIKPEYVEFRVEIPENIVGVEFSKGNVYINIDMNDEVIKEGLVREVVRRIQSMRKDMDLDINEKINVKLDGIDFSSDYLSHIANEVRGNFVESLKSDYNQKWTIKTPNEETYDISIDIEKNK